LFTVAAQGVFKDGIGLGCWLVQFDTYEYIGGFSLLSACAHAGAAHVIASASPQTPTKIAHIFFLMLFLTPSSSQDFDRATLCVGSVPYQTQP
jgi:hypothetical protein